MHSIFSRFCRFPIPRRVRMTLVMFVLVGAAFGVRADLTPEEQAFSKGLDSAAQEKYAATREFVHKSAAVIAKTIDPTTLGRKPQSFDAQYLQPGEAAMLSEARDMSNLALMKGIKVAAPPSSVLPPARGDLTSSELETSKGMNPDDREKYEATRAYVHKAMAIVAKTAAPASLGSKPKNFDARFLVGDEAKTISQARDMSNLELMKGIKVTK